jgi:hypothetical protein
MVGNSGMEVAEPPNDQIRRLQEILAENCRMTRQTRDLLVELDGKVRQFQEMRHEVKQDSDEPTSSRTQT